MKKALSTKILSAILLTGLVAGSSSSSAESFDNGRTIGVPMAVETLDNVAVGGPWAKTASYRFKAQKSGKLRGFKVFWKFAVNNPTSSREYYSAGNGGRILVSLEESNASAGYTPSGAPLASVVAEPQLSPGNSSVYQNRLSTFRFGTFNFSAPATITAGKTYHLVFKNISSSPASNYVSLNTLLGLNPRSQVLPTIPVNDLATMVKLGNGAWQLKSNNVPVHELQMDLDGNGTVDWRQGMGYIDSMAEHDSYGLNIQGAQKVRQGIVPERDVVVRSINVHVGKYHTNSGALNVQLTNASGAVLHSASVAASSVRYALGSGCPGAITYSVRGTYCHQWVTIRLASPITLKAWNLYRIGLSSPGGSSYKANYVQDGNVNYPFSDDVVTSNALAEYTTNGSTWRPVISWGSAKPNQDFQFFLGL